MRLTLPQLCWNYMPLCVRIGKLTRSATSKKRVEFIHSERSAVGLHESGSPEISQAAAKLALRQTDLADASDRSGLTLTTQAVIPYLPI
jgi:hypothetical protein